MCLTFVILQKSYLYIHLFDSMTVCTVLKYIRKKKVQSWLTVKARPCRCTSSCTSCSFPLPPHLSSGRHPDCHQPAAQEPAAVRVPSEEVHPQRPVLLPKAEQDRVHLEQTGLVLVHLQSRSNSGQKPVTVEGLAEAGERAAVWEVMDSECRTFCLMLRGGCAESLGQIFRRRVQRAKQAMKTLSC